MNVNGRAWRSIWVEQNGWSVGIIDQTALPHDFVTRSLLRDVDAAEAISLMRVRGAPLIGATAAYGMALAADRDASDDGMARAGERLVATRPTAVNLRWAVERMLQRLLPLPASERPPAAWAEAGERTLLSIAGLGPAEAFEVAHPGALLPVYTRLADAEEAERLRSGDAAHLPTGGVAGPREVRP